jgi:hypothetical protein
MEPRPEQHREGAQVSEAVAWVLAGLATWRITHLLWAE